ncbi:S46 family peptidase [uncultured Ferrimonas sp.]|uniref:S46 family peptidase n=1 Tax=uncultured Ferrimonas sp. TaxID=432640 RepID=UPI00261E49EA|nr:S46 family peptidase [uncultured Ferrimonas sp.]
MKKWMLPLLALTSSGVAQATEGMWQPYQLPALADKMEQLGFNMDANKMADLSKFPMNSVINFGGCSASFVSPKGLVVTNHHCGYGAIAYHSTPEDNILENGFLAKTLTQEKKPVPGYKIWITESMNEVTEQVIAPAAKLTGKAYFEAIERNKKALVAECEQAPSSRCGVYNFHHGASYFLVKELEIKDVRLVYTPSMSVGKYGGDIDNWMWPRHTGDFAFFRAYVGKDGKPAEYSEDNVPYVPQRFLKVSSAGLKDNDFVMVMGYPGRTNRYRTAAEVTNAFEWTYPTARDLRNELIEVIKTNSEDGSKARLAYEGTLAGLANYAKNYQSMIDGYRKSDFADRKQAGEQALTAWINGKGDRAAKYGNVTTELSGLIEQSQQHQQRDMILGYLRYNQMFATAQKLYRLANEKQKDDLDRKRGYQERDMDNFKAGLQRMERRYDATVDKAMLLHLLERYAALPTSERFAELDQAFAIGDRFDKAAVSARLEQMYANTELGDADTRLAWVNKTIAHFNVSKDPFIKLAVAYYDTALAQENQEKRLDGELLKARPAYMSAIIAHKQSLGEQVYADANSSLRVSFGTVKSYSPQDGLVATPFTTMEGLAVKATGEEPFDASAKQLQLIKDKQFGAYADKAVGSVPVNFLSTVDTTGGNSGSATINGDGELVGLLFDGVYESIIADWDYNPASARSIHVDSRYMLWVMDELDGADNLLQEMTIVK